MVFSTAQGASRNFTELAILRILSGAFEATADPAFVLITGMWYTRGQVPARIRYWYLASGLVIALGGLLGYGIGHVRFSSSRGALTSWKYEFLIVGALCSRAVVLFIFIPDSLYRFNRTERLIMEGESGLGKCSWMLRSICSSYSALPVPPMYPTVELPTLVPSLSKDLASTHQIPYGVIIALIILLAIHVNTKLSKSNRTYLMAATNLPTAKPQAARLMGYLLLLGVAARNIVGPFLFRDSEAPGYKIGVIGCMVSLPVEAFGHFSIRFHGAWMIVLRRFVLASRITTTSPSLWFRFSANSQTNEPNSALQQLLGQREQYIGADDASNGAHSVHLRVPLLGESFNQRSTTWSRDSLKGVLKTSVVSSRFRSSGGSRTRQSVAYTFIKARDHIHQFLRIIILLWYSERLYVDSNQCKRRENNIPSGQLDEFSLLILPTSRRMYRAAVELPGREQQRGLCASEEAPSP
ncbi:hypothetical protein BDZ89DRAFT_1174549 [Hymenopellis radicata]|nr:hypothetical protein BDZ89DRAFT_1174549 [Hymenopellis radicata]